jgi:hypothetical protein
VAVLLVSVVILAVVLAALVYSVRRTWPQLREQCERMRRTGGPRGADFDSYAADRIDRLPISGEERRR